MLCSFCLLTSWLASWSHCHTWGRRKCRDIFQREDVKWLIEPRRSGSLSPMLAGNKNKGGRHRQRGQGPRKAVSCRCMSTSPGISRKGGWMTAKRSFTALHLDFFVLQRHARACISLLSKGPSFVVAGAPGIQNSWCSIKLGACREPQEVESQTPVSHICSISCMMLQPQKCFWNPFECSSSFKRDSLALEEMWSRTEKKTKTMYKLITTWGKTTARISVKNLLVPISPHSPSLSHLLFVIYRCVSDHVFRL